jgi:myotubularin-related protein 1/2
LNIENIHHMRRSLDELTDICEPLNQSSWEEDWYSKVDASLWLRHLRLLIGGCHEVIRLMQIEKSCVVCHCSDGWDRTAQLCALAELLMDPYYRTCRGFVILIEKEWLSFGHKFHDRVGHGDATGYPGSQERSPIFVQWLDSVYQLTLQFPNAFEFSEDFLICIADHHLSCCYGTFLYNSEWERRARNLASKTTSLWSDMIGRQEDKPNLYNNCYNPDQVDRVLYPSSSIRNLKVWSNLWLRRDPPNQHN